MQYFDHYVISARIKPAFFVVLPLAVVVVVWWPQAQQAGGALLTFLVAFGAIGFLSNLISNAGNRLQSELFREWGGAPTTSLLRHRDCSLGTHTKQRYHRGIERMIPGLTLPTSEEEIADPESADEHYASAVEFLREKSRNKTNYPLVYSDNVAYGFARNLLMMRPWGLVSALTSVGLGLALLIAERAELTAFVQDGTLSIQIVFGLASVAVSLALLWIFTYSVTSEYVRGRAVRYARSLLAVCEGVNAES